MLAVAAAQASTPSPADLPPGDPVRGEAVAATCVACHQQDGSGMHVEGGESWPRLAGLDADYLAKQLLDYQAGTRRNATMQGFAATLDPQQIADVAAHYAAMPETAAQGGDAPDEVLARGRRLVEHGDWEAYVVPCSSCHGPDGRGVGASFPDVANQHAGYVAAQLRAWRDGTRANDPNGLMKASVQQLSDADVDAVAAWLAQLPPDPPAPEDAE